MVEIEEVAEKGEASDHPATRIAKRANKVLHKTVMKNSSIASITCVATCFATGFGAFFMYREFQITFSRRF